jgi:hypothetical protein
MASYAIKWTLVVARGLWSHRWNSPLSHRGGGIAKARIGQCAGGFIIKANAGEPL